MLTVMIVVTGVLLFGALVLFIKDSFKSSSEEKDLLKQVLKNQAKRREEAAWKVETTTHYIPETSVPAVKSAPLYSSARKSSSSSKPSSSSSSSSYDSSSSSSSSYDSGGGSFGGGDSGGGGSSSDW